MSENFTKVLVGCSDCRELWICQKSNYTTECPRCHTRYETKTLRKFAEDTDSQALVEQRTAILSSRTSISQRARDQYQTIVEHAVDEYGSLEDAANAIDHDLNTQAIRNHYDLEPRSPATNEPPAENANTPEPPSQNAEEPETADATPGVDPLNHPLPHAGTPGIRRLPPNGQLDLSVRHAHRGVPPQLTHWVPDLLEDLLPVFAAGVAYWTDGHDELTLTARDQSAIISALLEKTDLLNAGDDDAHQHSIQEAAGWIGDLVEFTIRALGEDVTVADAPDSLIRIGTGRGLLNAGRDAIRLGPARLLDVLDVTPQVAIGLDGGAWIGARTGTRERSLDAFAALADAVDLRILFTSPRVEQALLDAHTDWMDTHLSLTETTETSHPSPRTTDDVEDDRLAQDAWDIIRARGWDGTGYTRVLSALTHGAVTRGDLADDPDVGLSENSIYRYVDELEDAGFVTIDDDSYPSTVDLTPLGTAIAEHIAEDGSVLNPAQDSLPSSLTRETRECTPQHQQEGSRVRVSAAEEYLSHTGDAAEDGYTQFLGRYAGGSADREVEPATLHHQLMAARRTEGITVVEDANLQKFEDGRVGYLSGGPAFDDEVLTAVEWGNPLPTLARLVDALLGTRAWSKILRRSRLGSELEKLEVEDQFDSALEDVLKLGYQLGWMSEREENDYYAYEERLQAVRGSLLEQVGKFGELDQEDRSKLMEKLLGLFTTATMLYHAAGYDLTVNIRVPDVAQLQDDDGRYGRFLEFLRHVVSKQGVYRDENGVHSIYRMQREQRKDHLKYRLGYSIDPGQPNAEMTCSWIVSGDRDTDVLVDDVQDALALEDGRLRDRIKDGVEEAAVMDVPVVSGNGPAATREIVEEFAVRKGFGPEARQDLDRLVSVLHAALGTTERDPSPYDVAAVMQSLEARDRRDDELDVGAVANGIATLPANRILPSLFEGERPKTSLQKMLKALLAADGSLSRADLIDVSSKPSVDKYLGRLRALDIVEQTGRGKYRAYLEPWWVPANDERAPYQEGTESWISDLSVGETRWVDVLYGAVEALDRDPEIDIDYDPGRDPFVDPDFETILEAIPKLQWYRHLLEVYFDGPGDPQGGGVVATIGRPPAGAEPEQQSLTAASASD